MKDQLLLQMLWERVRVGDKDAFFDLYTDLYYTLVNFGLRICANEDTAAEATNDVFVAIWEKHETLARVENVSAYLHTFVKRKILRILENEKKMATALELARYEFDMSELSYEELIVRIQTDDIIKYKLQSALEKLTFRQKQLIHLKFFEGLSYQQIAEHTNQQVKTAYNTVYDALVILREELK